MFCFVNCCELLYGLSHTLLEETWQCPFLCVLCVVIRSRVGFLVAIVDTAMFNTTDKVTSPACELPLCVQLGPTLIASAPAAATVT